MDGSRFDEIARGLAKRGQSRVSRRRVLRGLTGAMLAVVGGMARPAARDGEAATCYASGEYCNFDVECCQGKCIYGICRCPDGLVNCNGICRESCYTYSCPSGYRLCNGICRDLRTDSRNCGRCGQTCAKGSHCSNGKCCGQGQVNCGGLCVPIEQCS